MHFNNTGEIAVTTWVKRLLQRIGNSLVGDRLNYIEDAVFSLRARLDRNAMIAAKVLINQAGRGLPMEVLSDAEFRVYSRAGEDGIIQFLIAGMRIENEFFVEFGVEDYCESNTRFLMLNNNWAGFVMDSSARHIERIHRDPIFARHQLEARCAHITKENINELLRDARCPSDIGLLSIDIDGNDYWVWEAIDAIVPRIVVCEYNSLFGAVDAVTIPYDPGFDRRKAHDSWLFFGASLPALCRLANRKGYLFVGCCKAGSNAFFVRRDVAGGFRKVSVSDGFRISHEREGRTPEGALSFVTGAARRDVIGDMKVLDLDRNSLRCVRDLS